MNWFKIDEIIVHALKEDVPNEDITTNALVSETSKSRVDLIAKENGIIAGLEIFKRVFTLLGAVDTEFYKKDGDSVIPGELIGVITGNTRSILTGERTALNILQRMSGIATLTGKFVDALKGTETRLLDTRKTTPNLRILEKYSVKVAGGENHRFNLSDGILIKDNHIAAAGGIQSAVDQARRYTSFVRKIEVEVESLDMVVEALEAKADIIMLDNMSLGDMKEAVKIVNRKALTEASGNVTIESIRNIAETGVDFISTGAVTHSYQALDLSMKNLRQL